MTPELEATLRDFALGRLAEGPRLALEERLVTEPDVLEALGVVEDELTEEYLERALSDADRRDYEQSFLASPDRKRLLGFVDSLKSRASRREPVPLPGPRASGWSWQLGWALAASVLLGLSLTANVWQGQRLAAPAPPTTSATIAPLPAATGEAPADRPVRQLAVVEPHGPRPAIPSFLLASGVLRGSGSMARVTVPAGAIGVRLLLALPRAEYPRYRVTLRSAEGDELWTAGRLRTEQKSGRTAVAILLPSELLARGDYLIALDGVRENGEPEAITSYAFRVAAK